MMQSLYVTRSGTLLEQSVFVTSVTDLLCWPSAFHASFVPRSVPTSRWVSLVCRSARMTKQHFWLAARVAGFSAVRHRREERTQDVSKPIYLFSQMFCLHMWSRLIGKLLLHGTSATVNKMGWCLGQKHSINIHNKPNNTAVINRPVGKIWSQLINEWSIVLPLWKSDETNFNLKSCDMGIGVVVVVEYGLTSHQTQYRSYYGRFYRSDDPINSVLGIAIVLSVTILKAFFCRNLHMIKY